MIENREFITVYGNPDGGAPLTLSEAIGRGGQGAIYAHKLSSGVEVACKIFNDRQQRAELSAKIHRMVEIGRENDGELISHAMIAWPQLVIYDAAGQFIGYAMKRARGLPLTLLAHSMNASEKFPDIDRVNVAKMLIRLWETVSVLHGRGIFIGDVNLGNFLCAPDYRPSLIDTDSYQVEGWKCPVGRPEMTPPEHLDKAFGEVTRTRESDLFSLAVLSFQCLMLGQHPYAYIGGGSPPENQRAGRMPYLKGAGAPPGMTGGVPKGPWYVCWDNYPRAVKRLFDRALREGAKNPSLRPSVDDWLRGLNALIVRLKKPHARTPRGNLFQHPREMRPLEPKPKDMIPLTREELAVVEPLPPRESPARVARVPSVSENVWDLVDNPTPRLVCALVADASSGMAGERIDGLNAGMREFIESIGRDDLARFSVEVEAFACGGAVARYSARQNVEWRDFAAQGEARIGQGVAQAIVAIETRQGEFAQEGVLNYRPWLVLLVGSDPADDCSGVIRQLRGMQVNNQIEVFVVGVGGYNADSLADFAPKDRLPRRMGERKFSEFFDWLARCMSAVSLSVPGYWWHLPPIDGWDDK